MPVWRQVIHGDNALDPFRGSLPARTEHPGIVHQHIDDAMARGDRSAGAPGIAEVRQVHGNQIDVRCRHQRPDPRGGRLGPG
jgi:hypothetical protein